MKTFSLILFFIVCSFLSFAQVNLNQGLVAYYPFNGNANDVSGNGINGAVNGLLNGKPLPTDVYYYIIKYKTVTGLGETKSGYITLLR